MRWSERRTVLATDGTAVLLGVHRKNSVHQVHERLIAHVLNRLGIVRTLGLGGHIITLPQHLSGVHPPNDRVR